MPSRRDFLYGASAGTLLALGLPIIGAARANPLSQGKRKFIFVFNGGGWDPTRVFAAEYANNNVDMELDSDLATIGNIRFADHPDRPSVRSFFTGFHDRTLVVNGMMVRSIAHEICTLIALTGTTASGAPDWPAILASSERESYILPHLVLDGPSFPGDLGVAVARTGANGQLEALLSGQALEWSDNGAYGPNSPAENIMDRYLVRRTAARADAARSAVDVRLSSDFHRGLQQAQRLKDMQYILDLSTGADLGSQSMVACEALSMGVSRCVTMAFGGGGWDTHANNDDDQSPLWESLFAGLNQLMNLLESTPGEVEATLAEETVVVVLSEMGRTPQLNDLNGKDHWPFTSAMLVGQGITGDRVIGSFDENYYGRPVDTMSGDVDEGGQTLSAEALGATLLALADIDPGEFVSGVEPIYGVLE